MSNLSALVDRPVRKPKNLPRDWTLRSLLEICNPQQWETIGGNSLSSDGFPVYGANGLIGYYHSYNHDAPCIAITCRGATCGMINLTPPKSYITGNAMSLDDLDPEEVNINYLRHALNHRGLRDAISGTAQPQITRQNLKVVEIPFPPFKSYQIRIAALLDTLDTAIHQTEAIIAKLKAVKQGLLHDLLTRGIDTNGELRPPQTEAPHLYKESPLGWIPKEWDVVRVGEDADIEHGFAFPGHQFTDKEVGPVLLVPGNFHREGGLYFTSENTKYFSGKFPKQYVLSRGDVLIVMTDLSPMTLILGRTVVLDEEFKVLHNQRIGKFRFRKDGLWDAAFFAETLSQDAVRLKVIAEATGTTVRHTSPDRIKSCYVARPKLQEQQCAAERIAVLDLRRKREETNFLKLKQTKSGLMDDLLTGRVRVTPLLDGAAP